MSRPGERPGRFRSIAVLAVAGCNFAPVHRVPPPPTATTYADATTGARAAELGWRDFFEDDRLEALIAAALRHNRDLAIAVARIEEAHGLYRIERADRLPTLEGTADATRSRAGGVTTDRLSIGVAVSSFELDFWGRVRNLSEAARSEYLATLAAQRAFRLSLIRQVATTYLASLEAVERLALVEATVSSRASELQIARTRLEAGITSALDLRQAESLLTQGETERAGLFLERARADNALVVLVGGRLPARLSAPLPLVQQVSRQALGAGLPSDLLLARPDIIAAEERLRAARANIGAARAAFLPSISLTGSAGFASSELGDLLGSDGATWSFGPAIRIPIFDHGRLRGNLTVAQARQDIALASYELAIQIAFQEVADALAGRRHLADQVAAQQRGVAAQRAIVDLARARYEEGTVTYLEVLDAERTLFAAEQNLLQLHRAEAENLVALYIALGGGAIERR